MALVIHVSVCLSEFLFPDDNLSKCQWIFTKLGMCIEIVQIWFGITNGQISSILTELADRYMIVAEYTISHFYCNIIKPFQQLIDHISYKKHHRMNVISSSELIYGANLLPLKILSL